MRKKDHYAAKAFGGKEPNFGNPYSQRHADMLSTFRRDLGAERDSRFCDCVKRFPLHLAVASGSVAAVRTLLAANRVHPMCAPNGVLPVHLAMRMPPELGEPMAMLILASAAGTPDFDELRAELAPSGFSLDKPLDEAKAELEKERVRLRKTGRTRAEKDVAMAVFDAADILSAYLWNGHFAEPD